MTASPSKQLILDDQARNVEAARELGLGAVQARADDDAWVPEVDAWLVA